MEHISEPLDRYLDRHIDPEAYFRNRLGGRLGRPSGNNGWHQWLGLCPFHADRRPGSLYVNTTSGAFKCHSCGASGGGIAAFERLLGNTERGL